MANPKNLIFELNILWQKLQFMKTQFQFQSIHELSNNDIPVCIGNQFCPVKIYNSASDLEGSKTIQSNVHAH